MVSAYTFMYFLEYVVGVSSFNTLKDGCEETSLVKTSLMNSKPGRPRSELSSLFWVTW